MNKLIVNCATGEEIEETMTEIELSVWQSDKNEFLTLKAEAEAKAVARQAILDRLGLTEEEARLLLG